MSIIIIITIIVVRSDIILGRDLITALGMDLNFSEHSIIIATVPY